jgi:hypothetical protein
MEIKGAPEASQQVMQRPKEIERQESQAQVVAEAEKKKQDIESKQIKNAPPLPDSNQGQTFSTYA